MGKAKLQLGLASPRTKMDRRKLLSAGGAALMMAPAASALAQPVCDPMGCVVQVSFPTFAAHYEPQYQNEWCWAAAISMLFSFYGHPVSQQRIVAEAYGGIVNMPAISGFVIALALNRHWTDDNRQDFDSTLTAAFDAQAGVIAISNNQIVQTIANGDPMIVGAGGHCTVATAVRYAPTMYGAQILQVGVFDPWPGRGARSLTQAEMTPVQNGGALQFLATASVT